MWNYIIGGAIAIIVALIVIKIVRDSKAGKSSCGCGCSGCASSSVCHAFQDDLHFKGKSDGDINL